MKPRTPAFPVPELERICYGEGFVAERLQLLKKARQIAMEHSMEAGEVHKTAHDRKATPHGLKVGDSVYIDNQLFLGKNKKFAIRWLGPFKVTKIINEQNVPKENSDTFSIQIEEIH